ncbi:MAG: hypothetical protein JXX14_07020 [Deltaproteobacteria bacterium]|nr:hypothetical protein [Deltaproteobacteria bacterium]
MTDTVASATGTPPPDIPDTALKSLVAREAQIRRKYVYLGAAGGAFFQTFYAVYNFSNGMRVESILDFSSVLMMLVTFLLTKYAKVPRMGYQLGVFTLIYINFYTTLFPTHDPTAAMLGFLAIPAVIFYILGLRTGVLWSSAVFAILGILMGLPSLFERKPQTVREVFDILMAYFLVSTFSFVLEHVRQKTFADYRISKDALIKATSQQNTIGGLVPICSSCSKIRNDNGFWQQLESYLVEHTPAHISSGICDACAAADDTLRETPIQGVPDELQSLYLWKDSEEANKKRYIRLVIFTGVPMLLTYAAMGFLQGNTMESIGLVSFGIALLMIAAVLNRVHHVRRTYHLSVVVTFALFAFLFVTPSPNATDYFWLFLIPLTACFVLGHRLGAIWSAATLAFAAIVFTLPWFQTRYPYTTEAKLFFTTTFILLTFFSVTMERVRKRYFDHILKVIGDLKQVYEGIRTLKGLVPVCSKCKAIRNDDGYWTRVDYYLYSHAEMALSHGICPDCLKREMPDLYEEMKAKGEL